MPPQWGPQQQWAANPQPGPGRGGGGKTKWILGGLVVALAIALAVVITVVLVRPDNNSDNTANDKATVAAPEFASANDTGPITIITEDPSCAPWIPINNTFADSSKNGWLDRDPSISASAWNPEQRKQYQEVGQALRVAADQAEPLVKLTSHRVMRELYVQLIAYARAYADRIPTYAPADDALVRAASAAGRTLTRICQAISSGAAAARAPLVPEATAPESVAEPVDPPHTERFLISPDPVCADWRAASDRFLAEVSDWLKTDPNISAGQWSPEQKALNEAVLPVMRESADTLEEIGKRSDNPVLQDFAILAVQYRRGYAQAIPTYNPADQHLYNVSLYSVGVILAACDASAGK